MLSKITFRLPCLVSLNTSSNKPSDTRKSNEDAGSNGKQLLVLIMQDLIGEFKKNNGVGKIKMRIIWKTMGNKETITKT